MKKLLWLLVLTAAGCTGAFLLNRFLFLEGDKFTAISSPTPSYTASPKVVLPSSANSPVVKQPILYTRGQPVTVENMDFKVVDVKPVGKSLTLSKSEQLNALGTWKAVTVDVTNTDDVSNSLFGIEFMVQDSSGKTFAASNGAAVYYATLTAQADSDNGNLTVLPNTELPPSTPARLYLLFDVPDQTGKLELIIKPLSVTDDVVAVDLS